MKQITRVILTFLAFNSMEISLSMAASITDHVVVAAPIDTESSAKGGERAIGSVIRIICPDIRSSGTGFFHKSGKIITAAHVVHGSKKIIIPAPDGIQRLAVISAIDDDIDIAVLDVLMPIQANPLAISNSNNLRIGHQVSTWGFPGGYSGALPMLSVGYLSGRDALLLENRKIVPRWVINAAFNSGNSGGPLVLIESGEVIGVVSSKLAPISIESQQAINALSISRSGVQHYVTTPDGKTIAFSEAQVIANVLNDLRGQIQLVIGYAVTLNDMRDFLIKNGIDP